MSIRVLGLLTTTTAVSLTLTAGIAAASAYAAPPPEPAVSDPAPSAAPSAAAPSSDAADPSAPPAAEGDKELKECADAECEVKVHDGQTIKLDKKYGLDPIHIKIDDSRATFTIRSKSTKMISTVDAKTNTSATYNGITFRPRLNKDGTMTLKISHD